MAERIGIQGAGEGAFALGTGDVSVVVVHEWWGLNDQVKGVCDRFADAGFSALAPDLYGRIAANAKEAEALMASLDRPRALGLIQAAARTLRSRGAKKVAVAGFCMGGSLALEASEKVEGLDGAVVFYGLVDGLDAAKVSVPLLLHFARNDDWCTPQKVSALEADLAAAGRRFELHRYEAQHAFMNETRPEVHDPALAQLAWRRTIDWLGRL